MYELRRLGRTLTLLCGNTMGSHPHSVLTWAYGNHQPAHSVPYLP